MMGFLNAFIMKFTVNDVVLVKRYAMQTADANSRFDLTSSGVVTLTATLTRLENFLIT